MISKGGFQIRYFLFSDEIKSVYKMNLKDKAFFMSTDKTCCIYLGPVVQN